MFSKVFDLFQNSSRKNKPIGYLNVITNTACSQKCRDCGNLNPYVKPEFYDIKMIIKDIEQLLKACKNIEIVQVQGGEPFIHPDIYTLLAYLVNEQRILKVQLASNGVASLKSQVIEILKHPKLHLGISDYYPHVNSQKLINVLKENNIPHKKYQFATGTGEWFNFGGIDTEREKNEEIVKNRFNSCPYSICTTLQNGILGRCARSINARQVFSFSGFLNDYLNLRDGSCDSKKIIDYFNNRKFMEACYYCYGATLGKIPPAIQLNKATNE